MNCSALQQDGLIVGYCSLVIRIIVSSVFIVIYSSFLPICGSQHFTNHFIYFVYYLTWSLYSNFAVLCIARFFATKCVQHPSQLYEQDIIGWGKCGKFAYQYITFLALTFWIDADQQIFHPTAACKGCVYDIYVLWHNDIARNMNWKLICILAPPQLNLKRVHLLFTQNLFPNLSP